MASGRVIHKAIHSNPDLGELKIEVRYFYKSLIIHADDDGRLRANVKHLKAVIFPFDHNLRTETLSEWLCELQAKSLIFLYVVDGKEYLCHPNWENWQFIRSDRYKPSDCPPPVDGIPMVNQRLTAGCQNLTQPNLTQPNLKGVESFLYLNDPDFKNAFDGFLEMRKKLRKPATDRAQGQILTDLHKHPVETAIKMLNQSVRKSWLDVYPLKDEIKTTSKLPQKFPA